MLLYRYLDGTSVLYWTYARWYSHSRYALNPVWDRVLCFMFSLSELPKVWSDISNSRYDLAIKL
jgi:hypothetical protein